MMEAGVVALLCVPEVSITYIRTYVRTYYYQVCVMVITQCKLE